MGVSHAVMVGHVDKANLLHNVGAIIRAVPDLSTVMMYIRRWRDLRSHSILSAVADCVAAGGVQLIDTTLHIPEHMASAGVMTRRAPTLLERADIDFAWPMLQELLAFDIGQAIAVRGRDVVAVEAIEGTDRMIARAGELCRGRASSAWVLLKGARAGHDRRSDVPTIGMDTIRNLHAAGGRCIAVTAGDVIILDKPQTISLADELGIAIVGMG